MKLSTSALLLFSVSAADAAFIRPSENGASIASSTGSRTARGMSHNGIDESYLQSELANFCNQKLVGGSLVSSLLNTESSPASSMLVSDSGSSIAAVHEKAMDWFQLGSAAISQAFLEFPSSFLSSSAMDFSMAMDPNQLVPSLIMLASMTVTVVVSSTVKSSNEKDALTTGSAAATPPPLQMPIEATATSLSSQPRNVPAVPELEVFRKQHIAVEKIPVSSGPMVMAAVAEEMVDSSAVMAVTAEVELANEKIESSIVMTKHTEIEVPTDYAMETPISDFQLEPALSSWSPAVAIPGATTVVAKNAKIAFQAEKPQQAAQRRRTATDPIILNVTRWFIKSLRLVRVSLALQSMMPLWRARRGEEAKLYTEMVMHTETGSWRKAIITILQSPWYRIRNMWNGRPAV